MFTCGYMCMRVRWNHSCPAPLLFPSTGLWTWLTELDVTPWWLWTWEPPQQPRAKDEDNGRRRRRGGIKNVGDIVNNVHCHAERQHRYSGNHNHLIKTAGFDFQPARKHKCTNTFQPKHPSLTHCPSDIVILLHCVLTLRVTPELFCLCTFSINLLFSPCSGTGLCLDSCLPGITLSQLYSAAGLFLYECAMTTALWLKEPNQVGGSAGAKTVT